MKYIDNMEEALAAQDLEAGDPVVTERAPWYLRWIHTLTFGYFGAKLIARKADVGESENFGGFVKGRSTPGEVYMGEDDD